MSITANEHECRIHVYIMAEEVEVRAAPVSALVSQAVQPAMLQ